MSYLSAVESSTDVDGDGGSEKRRRTEVQMATLADVGIKTIQRAKHVHRQGLDEQVLSGDITFSRACEICRDKTRIRTRPSESATTQEAGISTDATEPVQLSLTGYSSARASEIHTPTESQ